MYIQLYVLVGPDQRRKTRNDPQFVIHLGGTVLQYYITTSLASPAADLLVLATGAPRSLPGGGGLGREAPEAARGRGGRHRQEEDTQMGQEEAEKEDVG